MPLDIQMFGAEEYDFELPASLTQEMDEQMQQQDQEPEVVDDGFEGTDDIEQEEIEETTDDVEEESPEEIDEQQQDDHLSDDAQKRDAAFASMRRELDAAKQQAAFVAKMAEHYGITPEQLQQQWHNDQLEQEAEQQGVPVELLREQANNKQEIEQLRSQMQTQNVQAQLAAVTQKYNASQEEISAAVDYAQQNGLSDLIFNGTVPFEQAFKLANMDSLIQKAEKGAVQKNLSAKKARQQAAAPATNGGKADPKADEQDLDKAAADFAAQLIADNNFL